MLNNKKFLCIIPARGGSKGIPDKNIISLNGVPLISYIINSSIKSKIFDRIVVSTDSEKIASVARQFKAEVPFLRPSEISTDESLVEDAMQFSLQEIEKNDQKYYYVALLQCNVPLTLNEDIQNVASMLISDDKKDMVVSVAKPPCVSDWIAEIGSNGSMKNFLNICKTNRQFFSNKYVLNGAIYMGKWDIFYHKKNYYEQNTYAYIMPRERSIDIDSYIDLKYVEFLLQSKGE